MSVVIMTANRPRFAAENILKRSTQEKAAAYETYFSYCGKYEIQADKVIHYVDASLSPNLVGTAQERFFEFKDNRLSLRTFVLMSQREQTASHLIWERILTKDRVEY